MHLYRGFTLIIASAAVTCLGPALYFYIQRDSRTGSNRPSACTYYRAVASCGLSTNIDE
jgi:hypothetical protein